VNASSRPLLRLVPRSSTKNFCRSGATSFQIVPFEKPSNDHAQQRDRSGEEIEPEQRRQRHPHVEPVVAALESGDAAEQAEVDRERVRPVGPGVDAVQAHAHELNRRIGQREDGQRRGIVAARVDELEPGKAQDPHCRRPAPEARRVPHRLGHRPAAHRPGDEGDRARDRPPRVERAEDVAEEQAGERQPDPERNVDGGRGEVGLGALHPGESRVDDGHEDRHADDPADDVDEHTGEPAQPPRRLGLQDRLRPQDREADERQQQDHPGRPPEYVVGNGKVALADDPVGERDDDHGLTSSSAIWLSVGLCTSTSNTPSMSASKRKLTGLPASASFSMS
jgi:hypothetical protein